MPPAEIYIQAGLLPPSSIRDQLIEQIIHLATQLPEQDQQEILEYARMRVQLAERRGNYESRSKTRKATSES